MSPGFIVRLSMIALVAVVAATTSGVAAAAEHLDHGGQLGLSLMPGAGYRMIVRYNEQQTCIDAKGPDSKWICTNDVPAFADLGVSFGLTSRYDLLAELRLGIAREDALGVSRQFAFSPGLRIWLDRDGAWKFFTTLQLVYDHTAQSQDAVEDTDYGLRNANGLMYDPNRNIGLFVQLGETFGFRRWFRMEVDIGVGVQVRLP
jgi:hypothetical protein